MNGREKIWTAVGAGIAVGFIVAIGLNGTSGPVAPQVESVAEAALEGKTASASRHTQTTLAIERVAPSVVSITTEQPPTRLFRRSSTSSSDGSGVLIHTDGVILTNAHVVSSASRIIATFSDGVQAEARVVGLADDLDLAVLKVPLRPELTAVEIGSSSTLLLGETVIAIGNPFGLGHTVTTGVVSATSRALETDDRVFQDFIQTDASINPGNSGGPLLDREGKLIGITTSIRPDAEGIGFAIPIDRAIKVARDLVEVGVVRMPWLGVAMEDARFRLGGMPRAAAYVSSVFGVDSGDGLMPGDFITHVGSRPVQGRADLNAFLAGLRPGEVVDLSVIRGGTPVDLQMKTTSFPGEEVVRSIQERVGLQLAPIRGGRALSVVSVGRSGAARQIGLQRGDLILAADGERLDEEEDFFSAAVRALSRHRPSILITVRRGRAQGRIALPL